MVKRRRLITVLALAAAVIFVSAGCLADQPETAFNEIDTPVNQTTPVSLSTKFSTAPQLLIIHPRSFSWTIEDDITAVSPSPSGVAMHIRPLSELLCTFLI